MKCEFLSATENALNSDLLSNCKSSRPPQYFTEFDLATIAAQIDQQERDNMAEGGETEEYRRFINVSVNFESRSHCQAIHTPTGSLTF